MAVGLNGDPVGEISAMENDSSIPRSGIRGRFRERFVTFDAALLQKGENVLTLDLLPHKPPEEGRNYSVLGVMYDFLQLEVNPEKTSIKTDTAN